MENIIGKTEKCAPLHNHKRYEISIFTEGAGIFFCGKTRTKANEGKIFIIPPNIEHQFEHDENSSRIYIYSEFNNSLNFASPIVLSLNPKNEGQTLAEIIFNNRYGNSEYVSSLINAFVGFVLQNIKTENEINKAIKEVICTISENFFDCELNICKILNKSGYAEDYIRAQFKSLTGKTPIEFLNKVRISHACFLIDTYKRALSLTEISEKCGYTDYPYFSRRFKKIMGVSPRNYIGKHE